MKTFKLREKKTFIPCGETPASAMLRLCQYLRVGGNPVLRLTQIHSHRVTIEINLTSKSTYLSPRTYKRSLSLGMYMATLLLGYHSHHPSVTRSWTYPGIVQMENFAKSIVGSQCLGGEFWALCKLDVDGVIYVCM